MNARLPRCLLIDLLCLNGQWIPQEYFELDLFEFLTEKVLERSIELFGEMAAIAFGVAEFAYASGFLGGNDVDLNAYFLAEQPEFIIEKGNHFAKHLVVLLLLLLEVRGLLLVSFFLLLFKQVLNPGKVLSLHCVSLLTY